MRKFRLISLLVMTAILLAVFTSNAMAQKSVKDKSMRRGETKATLNPDMFGDPRIKKAYQVAKEIPWVLDSIYCYCMCEESPVFKHKSLLSCYVDNHAAMWDICLGEALRAFELYKKGYPVKKIRDTVEKEFKR